METYILISNLNDFIFCPRSIYFHNLYGNYSIRNYHRSAQTKGRMAHKTIDEQTYSTEKRYKTGISIYSQKYNLGGKIDIYDSKNKTLIERKRKIKTIYDGYKYQLYAQYFCMIEMGHPIKKLFFHSLMDNKKYKLEIPDEKIKNDFEKFIQKVRNFSLYDKMKVNKKKCMQCIYSQLCDVAKVD